VHTAWDLGYRDDTAIWWYQVIRNEIHVLDYYAVSGANIDELGAVVKSKPTATASITSRTMPEPRP
jgi:hypothetical protein